MAQQFDAWINPLRFLEVELSAVDRTDSISAASILSFLCPPGTPDDCKSFVERYKRIDIEPRTLRLTPAEPKILEKLVWPLRQAKASYVIGNNLSVVALCGMVAEMVAVLLWKLDETQLNGRILTETDERALWGRKFERLAQDRRVEILKAYGIITLDVVKEFDVIRLTRNQYLHRWSNDHDRLPEDAETCFRAAGELVVQAIGLKVLKGGTIDVSSKLVKYLEREDAVRPVRLPTP